MFDLLAVADAYKSALGIEDSTVSSRVFGDGKKLTAMRNGAGITIARYGAAMEWFSANWPENATWPKHVTRPFVERVA